MDRYSSVLRLTAILALGLLVSVGLNVALFYAKPEPKYFATDPEGRVTRLVPVGRPFLGNAALLQWAADTARMAYSLDFVHYREQLESLRDKFAASAFKAFLANMQSSGNIKSMTENHMVMEATAEPPTIIKSGLNADGRYSWTIEVPLTIVTHYGGRNRRSQRVIVQMHVVRVDNRLRPKAGVVVTQFLTELK